MILPELFCPDPPFRDSDLEGLLGILSTERPCDICAKLALNIFDGFIPLKFCGELAGFLWMFVHCPSAFLWDISVWHFAISIRFCQQT